MANSRRYLVCSPEYGTVDRVLDDGPGPMEYERDVLYVRTRTAKRAKVLALRAWRRARKKNWRVARWFGYGENPFVGMTVEVDVCEHGQQYRCIECERELSDSQF